jgi:hypothetical protein
MSTDKYSEYYNQYSYDEFSEGNLYVCNWCEGYVKPSRCLSCDISYNKQSVEEAIQRKILNVVRIPSSQFLSNKSTLISGKNEYNSESKQKKLGGKHDSYARYLSKKKFVHIKEHSKIDSIIPKQGNKTRAYAINKHCTC